ncbi:TPA: hypothetical protein DD425_02285 [Candidatus Saccharibacteria bacterium]|nr:hypothetical protein [Candidatus Saccharibacteria bacterium]
MKLFITRHGQTEDNLNGITMGQKDSPLTATGIRQAKYKASLLKRKHLYIARIYSSDIGRCMQTAAILSEELGVEEVVFTEGLREIHFGVYEGLPYSAIPERKGGYMHVAFPGGESNETMSRRVIDAINRIYADNKLSNVLIVTHSGPLAAILASCHNESLATTLANKVDNKSVIELSIERPLGYPLLSKAI